MASLILLQMHLRLRSLLVFCTCAIAFTTEMSSRGAMRIRHAHDDTLSQVQSILAQDVQELNHLLKEDSRFDDEDAPVNFPAGDDLYGLRRKSFPPQPHHTRYRGSAADLTPPHLMARSALAELKLKGRNSTSSGTSGNVTGNTTSDSEGAYCGEEGMPECGTFAAKVRQVITFNGKLEPFPGTLLCTLILLVFLCLCYCFCAYCCRPGAREKGDDDGDELHEVWILEKGKK
mmetsp:Transcript_108142/g.187744  ORF Transcript_108142/g.187744 Transcript_108142/m.187744 type:complete len:232 (+) Transcript_108142:112-807(+)